MPGIVIIRPAWPSEMWKPAPVGVSSPIGRISVVTIEKTPIITEVAASQPANGERTGGEVLSRVVVAVGMMPLSGFVVLRPGMAGTPPVQYNSRSHWGSGGFSTSSSAARPAGADAQVGAALSRAEQHEGFRHGIRKV